MDDYKKLKLEKKDDKGYMGSSKVIEPSGLKLKRAPIDIGKMAEEPKKPGKILRMKRKQSTPSLDARQSQGYRRVEQEPETETMTKEAMKEAMEKARLKRAMKEREMIKRIK
jgi:hypothetical protein